MITSETGLLKSSLYMIRAENINYTNKTNTLASTNIRLFPKLPEWKTRSANWHDFIFTITSGTKVKREIDIKYR